MGQVLRPGPVSKELLLEEKDVGCPGAIITFQIILLKQYPTFLLIFHLGSENVPLKIGNLSGQQTYM